MTRPGSVVATAKTFGVKQPLKNNRWKIPKSRYDSVSTYLSEDTRLRPEYNDLDLIIDEDIKKHLMENGTARLMPSRENPGLIFWGAGMDERLSTHFSHLFIRDPIVIFQETLDEAPEGKSDHFEVSVPLHGREGPEISDPAQNLQSTNWQHMRFKPPPPGGKIGWRVEFRSMEIQFTDFENAAFAIFTVLLTRVILSYNLNLYVPISKVAPPAPPSHPEKS